jgi:hypothetical protein
MAINAIVKAFFNILFLKPFFILFVQGATTLSSAAVNLSCVWKRIFEIRQTCRRRIALHGLRESPKKRAQDPAVRQVGSRIVKGRASCAKRPLQGRPSRQD